MGRSRIERIARRDDRWSESVAVGSEGFVEQVKIGLQGTTSPGFGGGWFVYSSRTGATLWRSFRYGK
jgi:hypothetical protein